VRLLCRFCWVILRGVTHYCTPLHVFHISVYYHATSYKTWETPGGSHIFLPDDRCRLFHACVCINTVVLTEKDALFVKYVIGKALSLFIQFINHFREQMWPKLLRMYIFSPRINLSQKKNAQIFFLFQKYMRLLQHVSNIFYNHLKELLIYKGYICNLTSSVLNGKITC
jgi:hypothetical protein